MCLCPTCAQPMSRARTCRGRTSVLPAGSCTARCLVENTTARSVLMSVARTVDAAMCRSQMALSAKSVWRHETVSRGATCSRCGDAFMPQEWQRREHMLLCPTCLTASGHTSQRPRDTPEARRLRAEILATNPTCHWCPAPATTIDHYPIPVIRGGKTVHGNVVPACAPCNKSRQDRPGPPQRFGRLA